jgi:hypothetical protein
MPKYTFEISLDAEIEDESYQQAGDRVVRMIMQGAADEDIQLGGAIRLSNKQREE